MAAILGVPYWEVVKAAIIPALAYYVALFIMVDRKAVQDHLWAVPASEIQSLKSREGFI